MSAERTTARIRFISAGAGSGKTYRLAELLQQMLVDGQATPAGVIATSFTVKAAAELRERVRTHLLRSGQPGLAIGIGQARIGTVNSICGALLARFAFEAGLPTELRVLDEETADQVLQEAIDEVIEGEALEGLLGIVRRLCLESVRYGQSEEPWRLAFREIVAQARSNGIEAATLRTFGARNAERLLRQWPAPVRTDLEASLRAAIDAALPGLRAAIAGPKPKQNTAAYLQLLEEALRDSQAGELRWAQWNKLASAAPEAGLRALGQPVAAVAAQHPAHPQLHEDLRQYLTRLFELAADALDGYARRKGELSAVDFADQERLLLEVLAQPAVAATLRAELDLLMVDEFQDTSPIQLALFLRLAALARHVVWVGDLKQAIYGFRGGDAVLMQAVLAALPGLGGDTEILSYSYRARPVLVRFVNEVFGTVFAGIGAEQVALQPKRTELEGVVAVEDWLLDGNTAAQCQALASGIALLLAEGVPVVDRGTHEPRPMRLADIGVLARSNAGVRELAAALRGRQIPVSTAQPGLLGQPEIVLALACLRRLNDERDTLASAEIVSLAECADPDRWLAHRLAWLDAAQDPTSWRESGPEASTLLGTIAALRSERPLLTPREALEALVQRGGLTRCVLQWEASAKSARLRLANLDRLLGYAAQYEQDCGGNGQAATLSGLLLWLRRLAEEGLDALAQPAIDAVQVMTHHAAKGLEWPVVVLLDLEGDIKDSVWDQVRATSEQPFDARAPLRDRFLRYWPWPYGLQKNAAITPTVLASPEGAALRTASTEEHKRLLYVSLTRARDLLIFARAQKSPDGEWMQSVNLAQRLPAGDADPIVLGDGTHIGFRRRRLNIGSALMATPAPGSPLTWFEPAAAVLAKPPLLISPSQASGERGRAVERIIFGSRLATSNGDRAALGEALHACIAADFISEAGLSDVELDAMLLRLGMRGVVTPQELGRQLKALRGWLGQRWPGARWLVEMPVSQVLGNGQQVSGRIDLLLRTGDGWVLFDHKSSAQGTEQSAALAEQHGGQLAAYRAAIEAVTGLPVQESWLVLAVVGAAVRVETAVRPDEVQKLGEGS